MAKTQREQVLSKRRIGGSRSQVVIPPEYRQALVCYIDIMGFKDLLLGRLRDPVDVRKTVLEVQRHLARTTEDPEMTNGSAVDIAFSDTVLSVRYLPGPGEPRLGVLFDELYRLQLAQIELLAKGILVRGGIALGDVYIDSAKEVWFGPAIVAAYELESNADYPRIILQPSIADEFKANAALRATQHTLDEEAEYVRKIVKRDVDGLPYIDPFVSDAGMFDEGPEGMLAWYRRVRIHLKEGAARHVSNPRVLRKFAWLANRYLDGLSRFRPEYRLDLELRESDFPGLKAFV